MRDDSGRIVCWAGINLDIGRLREAEQALRRSEERQRRALSAGRLAHWEWDIQNDRVTYQDSLQLFYGRPDSQPFANFPEYLTIIHPDDRDSVRHAFERAMEPGVAYEVEHRIVWPDGAVRWLAGRGATLFDEEGTPISMAGINLDVTERKAAEAEIRLLNEGLERKVRERTAELAQAMEAFRESERRFRAIFDSTFQFIGLIAPSGTLLEINQTALDFVAVARETVVGRPIWETPWWAHSEEARARLRKAISEAAEGRFVRYEEDHHAPEGERVTVDFSLKPVRDETGRVVLVIPEGRPITEQKRAAEALRLSEERFRGAFDAAAIGMALVAPDGRFLQVNRSLCEILGRPEPELLRRGTRTSLITTTSMPTSASSAARSMARSRRTRWRSDSFTATGGSSGWSSALRS